MLIHLPAKECKETKYSFQSSTRTIYIVDSMSIFIATFTEIYVSIFMIPWSNVIPSYFADC